MREKVDKTEKILSEFFCSCLRKIHPFQWGKTPKTSNSIVVTSFIYFPFSEKKACEGPYGVITGDSLCCALSRGLSWGAHTVQEHSHLSMRSLHQGGPTSPSSLSLPRERHTGILCVGCCCPQGSGSLPPPPFHPLCCPLVPTSLCVLPRSAADWGSDLC